MRSLALRQPLQSKIFLYKTILWVALLLYVAAVALAAGAPSPRAQLLAFLGIIFAFAHAAASLGRRLAAAFLALCLGVTFSIENLSIATGFPFGRCHFEVAAELPHIGAVPIIVGPLYFAMAISPGSSRASCSAKRTRGEAAHSPCSQYRSSLPP
jgi:uncharacterized membrane protein